MRLLPTEPQRGGDAVLADVVNLVNSLRQDATLLNLRPDSVGLGVAELVSVTGQILSDATIKWKNESVAKHIQKQTGLATTIQADVRAAARAESCFGAGREFASFLFITIGTGISASFVVDGNPYAGARGLTGTFASSPGLIPDHDGGLSPGPPLERFAAGPSLVWRLAAERPSFTGDTPEVLALAEAGDAQARAIVVSAARAVGAAVANLVNMLDPEAVIIGGGLGTVEGCYRDSLVSSMRCHIWCEYHRDLPVRSAQLGNDAGFIGAALAASRRDI
jgi:glucokinase